jgi:hypothetical protein
MAIRKKTATESETVRGEEAVKTGQKSSRARNAGAETASAAGTKTAKSKSPAAATHKAPARKTVNAAPAAEALVESSVIAQSTFDVELHHEEIRTEAYCHWLRNGCPQGSEHHDWLAAIEIVRARHEK